MDRTISEMLQAGDLPANLNIEVYSDKKSLEVLEVPLREFITSERERELHYLESHPDKTSKIAILDDRHNRETSLKLLRYAREIPEFSTDILTVTDGSSKIVAFSIVTFDDSEKDPTKKVIQTLIAVGMDHQKKGIATYLVSKRNERLRDLYAIPSYQTDTTDQSRKIFERLKFQYPFTVIEEDQQNRKSSLIVKLK